MQRRRVHDRPGIRVRIQARAFVKIATNSTLYANQEPDMDINAGKVLDGISLDELGQEIFEKILAVASGERTKSELAGVGEEEYNPWIIGAML